MKPEPSDSRTAAIVLAVTLVGSLAAEEAVKEVLEVSLAAGLIVLPPLP